MKDMEHYQKRKIKIVMKAVGGVLIVFLLGFFLLIHFYLSKINYQQGTENIVASVTSESAQTFNNIEETQNVQEESKVVEDSDLELWSSEQNDDNIEVLNDKQVFNILLIGYDSRNEDRRGRSDTNILISINQKLEEITMTSIMRDCYVEIPGYGKNRINAAYAYEGGMLLAETIEKNFEIHVDGYVAVNFFVFMDIIDVIGGVDIEVSGEEIEVMNEYIKNQNRLLGCREDEDLLNAEGILHLNGKQTLAYVRVRYVGNSDFDRTQRQRMVLVEVFRKMKEMNLLELNELLNTLLPEVTTDISKKDILFLLLKSPFFLRYEMKTLRIPADGTFKESRIDGMEVLEVDLKKNIEFLKREIYTSGN